MIRTRIALRSWHAFLTRSMVTATQRPLLKVIFVLGPPGSGKSTQSQMLADEFGMVHLSAGELLRKEQASGSPDGMLIDHRLKEGQIVPVQITLNLLRRAMEASKAHRFIIDGFPRNQDNLQGWEKEMADACEVEQVIFVDSPQNVLEERLILRGKASGRSDDNLESIRKRFSTYVSATFPIIQHYKSQGKLLHVSGLGNVPEVFQSAKSALFPLFEAEICGLTSALLDTISARDFERYKRYCDESMTCFEPEAQGNLVSGMGFHGFYLQKETKQEKEKAVSTMASPVVRLMGTSAVIAYKRVVQTRDASGVTSSKSFEETRVWQRINHTWKCVHFHRSS